MKIVIGTETYLSERFSKVWIGAMDHIPRKTGIYEIVGIAMFDNNPDDSPPSGFPGFGVSVYSNPGSTNIGVSIEQLAFFMHANKADAMIHIEIDALPEQQHIESSVKYLKENKVSGFTEFGGTHFFALTAGSCPEYMTAQRLPKACVKGESWWTKKCQTYLFDTMQYWFHYLHTTGWPVHLTEFGVLHAGGASYGQPGSKRTREIDSIGMKDWQLKSHEDYFNNPKVKKYL